MKFHPEEYEYAKRFWEKRHFPGLTAEQYNRIAEKGKEMFQFHRRHPVIHHLITLAAFAVIFISDAWVLLRLGSYIHPPLLASVIVGLLHAYMMYTLTVYTIHDGAAHKMIVLRDGRISHFFSAIANNLGRLSLAESDYYAKHHLQHHAYFTTPKDGEFLNFVTASRLLRAFVPYSAIFNFTDFKVHTGDRYTPSRIFSILLFLIYHASFVTLMLKRYSWLMVIIAIFLIAPNVAFWLDRLRQYTEHNLMPLNVRDGARDLGLDFWGILIGGGPWGQPCHWTHHLVPTIPWYNQIRLHNFIRKKILSPQQKEAFLLRPIIGFPSKLIDILRTTKKA